MKLLAKILSYPLSVIFYLFFGLNLIVFHPIQWFCLNVFGYEAHKKSVDYFNWFILRCLNIVGTSFNVTINSSIPNNVPIIIVSNHQSMWDIPPIIWYLRKYHPKFISKIELGKGIPSISYNLKHGGSVLIDRKNPRQATGEIIKIAKYVSKHNRSVVIFPEGTRSKDGTPKPFRKTGLLTLIKKAPDAYILPVSISNSWKLQNKGMFPLPLGVRLQLVVHASLKVSDYNPEELIDEVEKQVKSSISI
ncbi:1-acyl-sn-glycerol-3-phosphate acyltransferase [Marixanthomonas sp. SCSIO 43207]|uniref:lysophospholipid acyltransferase family protein n=1 Tax=Marixanthomonas sp. SCSIO 43207 TaxID=2779360 RepID=UPI001CA898D8|nr:lysophospholipid acyltransferase family protein [Marixanthomonas sp. SCSIO 43207]UAB81841.1 1-acyl-sn-glycerol-3-phosphate acyltransferase [Marixanthomonas sp. SCSIO 43207]